VLNPKNGKLVSTARSCTLEGIGDWCEEREEHEPQSIDYGDKVLPPELNPARDLYSRLSAEGEGLSTAAVVRYLQRSDVVVAMDANGKSLTVVSTNLSRRGLWFVYASARLQWILRGVDSIENGGAA
jgi:hypothetical protein